MGPIYSYINTSYTYIYIIYVFIIKDDILHIMYIYTLILYLNTYINDIYSRTAV